MRSIELKPLVRSFALAGAAMLSTVSTTALAADVSLYTTREPKLIQPLLDEFTKDTSIKVNTVFVKDGLIERVKAEGDKSPADVLMTVDIGNLLDLVEGLAALGDRRQGGGVAVPAPARQRADLRGQIGGAPCRERGCQYG